MFSAPTRGTSLALSTWPNSPKTLHVRQPNSYSELVRIMSTRPVALAVLMTVASALPALADARSDAKAQVAFGISVAQRGLWREAIYRWEKAVEIDPTYAAAFNDLAIAYEHEGQLEKARKAYERRSNSTRIMRKSVKITSCSRKSMTGRVRRKTRTNSLAILTALCAVTMLACGPETFEIPIETPIQPKLDVSAFQRVLVAGFVAGGSDDLDTNQETVRLLRSQLRNKSSLKVIDADVMPLIEIAHDQNKSANAPELAASGEASPSSGNGLAAGPGGDRSGNQTLPLPEQHIKDEKDLEPYERLFANVTYWKRIGEEYQNPLIVTGTVLFTAALPSRDRTARAGSTTSSVVEP